MSPNLSSGHFAKNKLIYEQVIYNMLSLVGLATTLSVAEARRYAMHYAQFHGPVFYYYRQGYVLIFVFVCRFVNVVHLSARLANSKSNGLIFVKFFSCGIYDKKHIVSWIFW